jgi:hypothetical protein
MYYGYGYGLNYKSSGVAVSYIVDDYSPNAAYSLRKVSSTATKCIRVRRSSDNAEQDFGFVGQNLDTASLLSFVGANNGFVVKIYEQGGVGSALGAGAYLDAVMSSSSIQPKIVNAGSLITLNGLPSMLFDGSDDRINFGVYDGLLNSNWDVYSVIQVNTGSQFVTYVSSDNTAPTGSFYLVGTSGSGSGAAVGFSSLYKDGAAWSPVTRGDVYTGLATSTAKLLTGIQNSTVGWGYNGYGAPFNFVGYWSESIFFENNNSSSIRTDIETNINTYYAIY